MWDDGLTADETADLIAVHIGAEPVKAAWIRCTLRRGVSLTQRLPNDHERALVWALPLSLRDASLADAPPLTVAGASGPQDWGWPWLEVRQGDDLAQAAGWFAYRYDLGDESRDWIRARLEALTPEHQLPAWGAGRPVSHRVCATGPPSAPTPKLPRPDNIEASNKNCTCKLVVGLTTCKRLNLFRRTATSLLKALGDDYRPGYDQSGGCGRLDPLVCRIVVVDDGSPIEDIAAMALEFPSFEFVLKPAHLRGHARSLNLLLSLVRPRPREESGYFMYLEDDWLFLDSHPKALHDAISILDASRRIRAARADGHRVDAMEPVEEVLLNDQASRACAYADTDACLATPMGSSGWVRTVPSGNGADTPVEYRLHEFGSFGDRGFGFWPGFSLNPAVWDLEALDTLVSPNGDRSASLAFDVDDRRFEQSMSLFLAGAGVRIAYLPRMTVRHLGTETSAYELNNLTRPWDRS